jgi:hypothetical protein
MTGAAGMTSGTLRKHWFVPNARHAGTRHAILAKRSTVGHLS